MPQACVRVCACVRACMHACERVCVCARVCARVECIRPHASASSRASCLYARPALAAWRNSWMPASVRLLARSNMRCFHTGTIKFGYCPSAAVALLLPVARNLRLRASPARDSTRRFTAGAAERSRHADAPRALARDRTRDTAAQHRRRAQSRPRHAHPMPRTCRHAARGSWVVACTLASWRHGG